MELGVYADVYNSKLIYIYIYILCIISRAIGGAIEVVPSETFLTLFVFVHGRKDQESAPNLSNITFSKVHFRISPRNKFRG